MYELLLSYLASHELMVKCVATVVCVLIPHP